MTTDQMVFVGTFGLGCFFLGMTLGVVTPQPKDAPAPRVCPVIEGQKPISTSSTVDGEYCFYVKTKGMAINQRRVG